MKKIIVLALGALVLTGCTSVTRNYVPQVSEFSIPAIGSTVTTSVGEEMVNQGTAVKQDALRIPSNYDFGTIGTYHIPKGDYPKIGEDSSAEFYAITEATTGQPVPFRPMINDPLQAMQVRKNGDFCLISVMNVAGCEKNPGFKNVKIETKDASAFQQTLIYNGKVGNKINIGYREFTGGMARDAFRNEVEYDLSDSKVISYKGAELEVLDANNSSITFRLIKNFTRK